MNEVAYSEGMPEPESAVVAVAAAVGCTAGLAALLLLWYLLRALEGDSKM